MTDWVDEILTAKGTRGIMAESAEGEGENGKRNGNNLRA
jgi:hypothetical protein